MKRRSWLMVICCVIPLLLLVALFASGILGSWGFYALIILICPLAHLVLMRHMHHDERKHSADVSLDKKPHMDFK